MQGEVAPPAYDAIRATGTRMGLQTGEVLRALLELHNAGPYVVTSILSMEDRELLRGITASLGWGQVLAAAEYHTRGVDALHASVVARFYDVMNALVSYQQHDHKLDELNQLVKVGASYDVPPSQVLGIVRERLLSLWRESPHLREHLSAVQAVFEAFVKRYRISFVFGPPGGPY
jgi:hypothetical protein